MRNRIIIIGILILGMQIITVGCSRDKEIYDDMMISIEKHPEEQKKDYHQEKSGRELSGKITVSTYFDYYIKEHAEDFMDMHPDTEIIVKEANDGSDMETFEMYSQRVAVELMSGTSCDLVDLSNLDIGRYVENGLLYDFYDIMKKDDNFNQDEYYMNIFKAMEHNKHLYAIPFAFNYDMVYVSKPLAEKANIDLKNIKGLNYIDMLNAYEKIKRLNTPNNVYLMPGVVKESFFEYEFGEFYSKIEKEANFNSQEFLDYLTRTDSLATNYNPDKSGSWSMDYVSRGRDCFLESQFLFAKFKLNAVDFHNFMIDYPNAMGPIPLLSGNNNAVFNTFLATYGIAQNSGNKELAWEFIKYCISEKATDDFDDKEDELAFFRMYEGWIPINRKNFYSLFRYYLDVDEKNFRELDIDWKDGDKEILINDALNKIDEWNSQRNKLATNFEVFTLVKEQLIDFYYNHLTTAKETGDIIQNIVETYLNE